MVYRTSNYFYDEDENISRVVVNEIYEDRDLCAVDEDSEKGAMLEETVEIPCGTVSPLCMAAALLSAVGLGISVARLLQDR